MRMLKHVQENIIGKTQFLGSGCREVCFTSCATLLDESLGSLESWEMQQELFLVDQ
jgi:hypothetical protein